MTFKKCENKIVYQDEKILKFLIESKIYGNKEVIIDSEDWCKVKTRRWNLLYSKTINGFYVRSSNRERILLHRFILNVVDTRTDVDHIFKNTLDNRKNTLRKCTRSENLCNRGKQRNNTSGQKGVYWHVRRQKWMAQIKTNKKVIYVGLFKDKTEAVKAYNEAALKYHGEFASLNRLELV